MTRRMPRRRFIATSSVVGLSLSGCLGAMDGDGEDQGDGDDGSSGGTDGEDAGGQALVNVSSRGDFRIVPSDQAAGADEVLLEESSAGGSADGASNDSVTNGTGGDAAGETDQGAWSNSIEDHSGMRPSRYEGERKEEVLDSNLWEHRVDGGVLSTPTVADGWLYFGSLDNGVYAVKDEGADRPSDPTDVRNFAQLGPGGREEGAVGPTRPEVAWSHATDDKVGSTPALHGDALYVGSYDGGLYALDRFDGSLLWRHDAGAPVNSSPSVADGAVFVGSDDGDLNAVEAEDGSTRWTFGTGQQIWCSPSVADGTVYVGSYDGNFYAVDADSGEERWRHETTNQFCASSPAVVDGTVHVGSTNGKLYALDAETGSLDWRFQARNGVIASPHVEGDTVYAAALKGRLYAVDAATGEERWHVDLGDGDRMYSSPTVVDGTLYAAAGTTVYELDPATGETLTSHETSGTIMSSPTVADGVVYIGSTDGYLTAF